MNPYQSPEAKEERKRPNRISKAECAFRVVLGVVLSALGIILIAQVVGFKGVSSPLYQLALGSVSGIVGQAFLASGALAWLKLREPPQ